MALHISYFYLLSTGLLVPGGPVSFFSSLHASRPPDATAPWNLELNVLKKSGMQIELCCKH